MKVIVARHGQTDYNVQKRLCGNSDNARLTELGKKHARKLCDILKDEAIGAIYCSDLTRAVTTAEFLSKEYGMPLTRDSRIREMDFGIFEGTTDEERKISPYWHWRERDKFNYKIPEGESYRGVLERVEPFVNEVLSSSHGAVAMVGHGIVNRAIIAHLLDLKPEEFLQIGQPNSIVYFVDTELKRCSWRDSLNGSSGDGFVEAQRRI